MLPPTAHVKTVPFPARIKYIVRIASKNICGKDKNMEKIVLNNLSKHYGEKHAVDGISLTVNDGEMLALLGVNGAGKTTTIKMLSCLTKPTGGTAKVGGFDIVADKEKVKEIVGISTQDTAIARNLTVEENLRFMAEIYLDPKKYGKKEIKAKVEEVIEDFKLEEVRKTHSCKLSGGWQRRLSIAMAIIGNPEVILLDEPTLGLDVLARRELWKAIEKLKEGRTIILTTHYMEEAEALADRIAIMIAGKIIMTGTLAELEEKTGQKGLENVFVSVAEGK